jgi:iron complex outermembrane receptor protein
MHKNFLAALAGSSLTAIIVATPVWAQSTGPHGAEAQKELRATEPRTSAGAIPEDQREIVITGTQIRGITPPGSNMVSLSEQDIEATGATSTQQLLATLPQTSSFNNLNVTQPGGGTPAGVSRVPIARPNIRNLPGCAGSGSGACTLILMDGHRIVPAGIEQTAVDPAVIPPRIIERVETILDGNSAIYGSDAIGGVINFITRKRFKGVKADASYGFGDDYHSVDANLTGGISWDTGGIVATYSFTHNDAIFGRDRDYIKSINWLTGQPTGNQCDRPNVSVTGFGTFAAPTFAPGLNRCDPSLDQTMYPENRRHTGYLSLNQDLGTRIKLAVTGFYSDFRTESNAGPFRGTVTVRSNSPFFSSQGFTPPPGVSQYSVLFSYGPAFGNDAGTQVVGIKAWQITPTLTVDLAGDWQVRALGAYGRSETTYENHSLPALIQATNPAINPFNIAATDPAVLQQLGGFFDRGSGVNKFYNARIIADGTLLALPGGRVKAALGVEYQKGRFIRQQTNLTTLSLNPAVSGSVESKSVFGELFVPIVGEDNSMPGIHRLNLSLSGRYDHYDQGVGGTFNPKVALTYLPTEWVTFRGNWGKSFNAPTPADRVGAKSALERLIPCPNPCGVVPTGTVLPPAALYNVISLTGTVPDLTPQKSTNWALGADLRPPFAKNLVLSATYYNIKIKDFISFPQITGDIQAGFRNFPELSILYPNITPAVANAFCALAPASGPAVCAAALAQQAGGVPLVHLIDGRTRNLGLFKVSGLDFSVTYRHDVNFGSLDLKYSGNFQLKRDFAPHPADPLQNTLFTLGVPDFTSSLTLGATAGPVRLQITWNHTGKYDFLATPGVNLQDTVDGFDSVDLYFRYGLGDVGMLKDLAFTVNVNNVLDAEPPAFRTTIATPSNGIAPNIKTLGRVIQLGINTRF